MSKDYFSSNAHTFDICLLSILMKRRLGIFLGFSFQADISWSGLLLQPDLQVLAQSVVVGPHLPHPKLALLTQQFEVKLHSNQSTSSSTLRGDENSEERGWTSSIYQAWVRS